MTTCSKHKILLVEDDPDDAEITLAALENLPFEFYHIDDGPTALKHLLNDSADPAPTAIMLDLRMPKVDGIEILARLKLHPTKSNIPVFCLISSKEGIRYVESFGLRPNGYLTKPVSSKDFMELMSLSGLKYKTHHTGSEKV